MEKGTALVPLSADPITFGHLDIIERASKIFKKVIVALGENPSKNCMFSLDQRLRLAKTAIASLHLSNVELTYFSDMTLVDYAYENGVQCIVKGARNGKDFDYELELHQIGVSQKLDIETIFLPTNQQLTHISSTAAKALFRANGFIHEYVPVCVKAALEKSFGNKTILGITGTIGSGKSYISDMLCIAMHTRGYQAHNIDLDHLAHRIHSGSHSPEKVIHIAREQLLKHFPKAWHRGNVDRKKLGDIVFNAPDKLEVLNKIMEKPILSLLRKEIGCKKGLVVLNAALLAEANLLPLCNNNVILVNTNSSVQSERLLKRGMTTKQAYNRVNSQFSYKKKRRIIEAAINKDGYGSLKVLQNDSQEGITKRTEKMFDEIYAMCTRHEI